jgi:uncharacterized membrane protein
MRSFCNEINHAKQNNHFVTILQAVSKRMTSDSSMKKKQIVVQERCLACGNGSPALPPARVSFLFASARTITCRAFTIQSNNFYPIVIR